MLNPIPPAKWNYATAAHLINRAGFGGPPSEVDRLVSLGPEKAVSYFVDYERVDDGTPAPEWAKPDPERFKRAREFRQADPEKRRQLRQMEQREQRERIVELRQWWLQKMASGPRPLQEKLVLFWHGHFATSAQKVRTAYFMWRQNETFREHASGNWLKLLTAVSKDPAMLIWLDQAQSRKEHPNENFAREVMELFALGEGNYTEKDILEAARALTGWSLDRPSQEFVYRQPWHDEGEKTIFGKAGRFDGDDVLKLIVEHPKSAEFITRKLWTFFATENAPNELIKVLAARFRESGHQFKPLLRTLFLCEEFYAPEVIRQQVKSPVQFLVGSARILERPLPPAQVSSNALRLLGQDLLLPPNVKGWDGGLSWITTNNLLNRYNFAGFLVLGENPMSMAGRRSAPDSKNRDRSPRGTPANVEKVLPKTIWEDHDKVVSELERRLLQGPLRPNHKKSLREYLDSQGTIDEADILHAIRLVMCTPEFQLT